MDWDDKVERPHLHCARSGRAIQPGERYWSALRFQDGSFLRLDIAEEHWPEQDRSELLSWWHGRRPAEVQDSGPRLVDLQVLASIFDDLQGSTQRPQQCFVWLLALLLTRAKKLRYRDLLVTEGVTWMEVQDRRDGRVLRIRDPGMSAEEQARVEQDFAQIFTIS